MAPCCPRAEVISIITANGGRLGQACHYITTTCFPKDRAQACTCSCLLWIPSQQLTWFIRSSHSPTAIPLRLSHLLCYPSHTAQSASSRLPAFPLSHPGPTRPLRLIMLPQGFQKEKKQSDFTGSEWAKGHTPAPVPVPPHKSQHKSFSSAV